MLNLNNITLLCVETREPELAHWAIDQCLRKTSFGKIVLITNLDRVVNRRSDIEYVQAPPITTTKDYSDLLLMSIDSYVQGTHVLIIQWDSFITHPELWRDDFLEYDYIGPVWPHHPQTPVGNGGFSLRSVKLLQAIKRPEFIKKHPEDYCICADNREFLEQECGIQFAPTHLAEQFAVERSEWHEAFGFHGFFNFGKVLGDNEIRDFLSRSSAITFKNIDAYELLDDLLSKGRKSVVRLLRAHIRFAWKYRRQYLRMLFIKKY